MTTDYTDSLVHSMLLNFHSQGNDRRKKKEKKLKAQKLRIIICKRGKDEKEGGKKGIMQEIRKSSISMQGSYNDFQYAI